MTGTGMVTVAGVGADPPPRPSPTRGEGDADGEGEGDGDEDPPPCPSPEGEANPSAEGSLTISETTLRLNTAPARATPPTVRNCRLVATRRSHVLTVRLGIFQKHEAFRHGFARW